MYRQYVYIHIYTQIHIEIQKVVRKDRQRHRERQTDRSEVKRQTLLADLNIQDVPANCCIRSERREEKKRDL